jgi:hypothetical protein
VPWVAGGCEQGEASGSAVRKRKEYLTPQLNGPSEFNGAGRDVEHTEMKRFFMLQDISNGYFFPEAKTYAVVHVVDERGFEAV